MRHVRNRCADELGWDGSPADDAEVERIAGTAVLTLRSFLAGGIARRLDQDSLVDLLCICLWRATDPAGFEYYVSVGLGATTTGISARLPGYVIPVLEYVANAAALEVGQPVRSATIRIFSAASVADLNGFAVSSAVVHAFYQFALIDAFIRTFAPETFFGPFVYEIYRDTPQRRDEARLLAGILDRTKPAGYEASRQKLEAWAKRRDSTAGLLYACLHPIMFTDWVKAKTPHAVISYGGLAEGTFRTLRRLCIETIATLGRGYEFPLNAMFVSPYHKAPPYTIAKHDLAINEYLTATPEHVAREATLRDDYGLLYRFVGNERRYREFLQSFLKKYPIDLLERPEVLRERIAHDDVSGRLTPHTRELLARLPALPTED